MTTVKLFSSYRVPPKHTVCVRVRARMRVRVRVRVRVCVRARACMVYTHILTTLSACMVPMHFALFGNIQHPTSSMQCRSI